MRKLATPRHIAASVLVFLLLGGMGGAVVGAVHAAEEEPAPDPFTTPRPAVGDRGRYVHERAVLDDDARRRGFDEDRDASFAFGLGAGAVVHAADGSAAWAYPLRLEGAAVWPEDNVTHFVDWASGTSLAVEWQTLQPGTSGNTSGLLPGTQVPSSSSTVWMTRMFRDADLPCALAHPYVGRPAPEVGQRTVDAFRCDEGANPRNPNRIHAIVETIREGTPRTMVVGLHSSHPDDVPRAGAQPDMRFTFREDVPYAVEVEDLTGSSVMAPGDRLVLEGFERGSAEVEVAVGLAPLEPLAMAPTMPWGIDDAGLDHPFPLSTAFAHVLADPTEPALREFLRDHPDAYTFFARHASFDMDGRHTERWEFAVTDCTDHLYVRIALDREEGTMLAPGVRLPTGPVATHRYETGEPDLGDGCVPPSLAPKTLPRAASILAHWVAHMPEHALPDVSLSWGFDVGCADEACSQPAVMWSAGQTYYYRIAGPGYPVLDDRVDVWDTSEAVWRDGELGSLVSSQQVHSTGNAPPPREQPETVPLGLASVAAGASPAWLAPTPAQAAGISLAAVLGALAYYLWPAVKSGGVGLFSRVRTDRLLEHPTRARLAQAVEAQPGIHQLALVRASGASASATDHHLRKMVAGGLLVRHTGAGFTCYFPKGAADRRVMGAAPVLKSPVARAILLAAQTRPGIAAGVLAKELDVSAPTVSYHLRRLEGAGLVESAGGIRATRDGMAAGMA